MTRAEEFYAHAGRALVDERNYPQAIVEHLDAERACLKQIIRDARYTAAVEVGCADGCVHLQTLLSLDVQYLGIDLVPRFVSDLDQRLRHQFGRDRARAQVLDACRVSSLKPLLGEQKVLLVFPFNSFGNLEAPQAVLGEACGSGFDLLILTYRTDLEASVRRREYYARCNLTRIRQEQDERGVIFSSDEGLHSYAYHPSWLLGLVERYPFHCRVESFGSMGCFYWCRLLQES